MLMHNYYKTKERDDKRAILFKEMFHEYNMVIAFIFAKTLFYILLSESLLFYFSVINTNTSIFYMYLINT